MKTPVNRKPAPLIQPSTIAWISLCDWVHPKKWEIFWRSNGHKYDPRVLGRDNRFTTKEQAIEFARTNKFGGYRIEGKTTRL